MDEDYIRSLSSSGQGATLHGNLPNDHDARNMNYTPRDRTGSTTRDRGAFSAQPSFRDGILNLRPFKWGSHTYMMAPPVAIEGDKSQKAVVLSAAIKSICSGDGTWANKTMALISHFSQQALSNQADMMTASFDDPRTLGLYVYEFERFVNGDMTTRAVPGGVIPFANQPGIVQPVFRTNVKYVQFALTVNSRHLANGTHIPNATTRPAMLLKLLLVPNPGAQGTYTLDHTIHDGNGRDLVAILNALTAAGSAVQMGILKDSYNDQDAFVEWLKNIKDHTRFEVVATLMQPAYVCDGVLDTAINRLQMCKQKWTDESGRTHHPTFEQHYQTFNSIVAELDPAAPYGIDTLKDKLIKSHYQPPRGSPNVTQHAELIRLKDLAIAQEGDLKETLKLVQAVSNTRSTRSRTTAASAFMYNEQSAQQQHSGEAASTAGYGRASASASASSNDDESPEAMAFAFLATIEAQICVSAQVFVSTAETAMRRASGEQAPMECWGCTNDDRFHQHQFHRFNNCPNREDPEVKKRAMDRIQNLRNAWKERRQRGGPERHNSSTSAFYTPAEVQAEWSRMGFKSKDNAENAMALMARSTNAKKRKGILAKANYFNSGARRGTPTTDNTSSQESINAMCAANNAARNGDGADAADEGDVMANMFLSHLKITAAASVMTANIGDRDLPLKLSKELPHIQLSIGDGTQNAKLLVAADSCAGTNLGEYDYHAAMYDLYPELVHSFRPLSHYNEKDIILGGANHNDSLAITHLIVYKTPMQRQGKPCFLSFGLSKEAAATAIVSITFLRHAKALWNFDNASPLIYFQTWNESASVQYLAPSRRTWHQVGVHHQYNGKSTVMTPTTTVPYSSQMQPEVSNGGEPTRPTRLSANVAFTRNGTKSATSPS